MLPNIAQQALNASNNVANQANELEVAMTIATMADSQSECARGDFSSCVENAAAAAPPCKDYIQTIGKYVKDYAGGKGAPLIVFLDFVGKKYGSQKLLGKDFFEALTNLDIPSDHTKFPFLRTAAICCNLVSPKVQYGYARFLKPEDINTLKTKALRVKVEQVEKSSYELLGRRAY